MYLLIRGKRCSTHWVHVSEFKKLNPAVEDGAMIPEHDNIYSSGGASRSTPIEYRNKFAKVANKV
ncbi:hypothetical protein C5749_03995 [Sphingobacterium gobiense]|uniref:Uncharacterized protein n=1 Tax=Sphingobacterium gobiense TaxID=1382456 RepID=A0A2S9JT40_9SPHI|nr:hypothetical protein C5749_03995 [Sphingobacterium gobiense]